MHCTAPLAMCSASVWLQRIITHQLCAPHAAHLAGVSMPPALAVLGLTAMYRYREVSRGFEPTTFLLSCLDSLCREAAQRALAAVLHGFVMLVKLVSVKLVSGIAVWCLHEDSSCCCGLVMYCTHDACLVLPGHTGVGAFEASATGRAAVTCHQSCYPRLGNGCVHVPALLVCL